jgi:hypothetical protein
MISRHPQPAGHAVRCGTGSGGRSEGLTDMVIVAPFVARRDEYFGLEDGEAFRALYLANGAPLTFFLSMARERARCPQHERNDTMTVAASMCRHPARGQLAAIRCTSDYPRTFFDRRPGFGHAPARAA